MGFFDRWFSKGNRDAPRRGMFLGKMNIMSIENVRELGGFPTPTGKTLYNRFVRSGSTANVTAADAQELARYGVKSVLDLRGEDEATASPDPLATAMKVDYVNVPFFDYDLSDPGLDRGDDAGGYLAQGYFTMLANHVAVRRIFRFLAQADENSCTLFHCGAGSDRTGVLSMLLLSLAGVGRKQLIADYAYSFGYIPEVNAAIFEVDDKTHRAVRPELQMRIDAMATVYDRMVDQYGSTEEYLLACGVRQSEIDQVRSRLMVERPQRYHMYANEMVSFSADARGDGVYAPFEDKRQFFIRSFDNPNKVTADLYYIAERASQLTNRLDQNQHDRSFHDHEYVLLEVPEEEPGNLYAPIAGRVIKLSELGDPRFNDGSCGEGIAILPQGNTAFAPTTCRITAQLDSHNALGLLTQDGVEMLMTVGTNVETYSGRGFRQRAWQNDSVRRGAPLLTWDRTKLPAFEQANVVMLIVTNSHALKELTFLDVDEVSVGDPIATYSWGAENKE